MQKLSPQQQVIVEIPLTKGKVALVDKEDYIELCKHIWYVDSDGYATRVSKVNEGRKRVFMARQIMNPPLGFQVDHINGNKLDNRRSNLRLATPSQNEWNKKAPKNNTSGYKGVRKRADGKFEASIQTNWKRVHLGRFITLTEAINAYNEAAKKYHGEFANINKI